jgi:hypothetical protein
MVIKQAHDQDPSLLKTALQHKPGAPFRIALFADLHFGEAASTYWGPQQDVNSTKGPLYSMMKHRVLSLIIEK